MLRVSLSIAVAHARPITAWAFSIYTAAQRMQDQWLHSGTGTGTSSPVVGGFLALAAGLQEARKRGLVDGKLTVWLDVREVVLAVTTPAMPLDPIAASLCQDCRDELAAFRKWEVKEHDIVEDNKADHLARWAWEAATFRDFPERPTRRKWLPAFTREAVA